MSTPDMSSLVMCPCCGRLFDAAKLGAEAVGQCSCETLFRVPDAERARADCRRANDLLSTAIHVDRAGQGGYACPGPVVLADWVDQGRVAGSDLLGLEGHGEPVVARCHDLTADRFGQDAGRPATRSRVDRLLLAALGVAEGVTLYDGREQLLSRDGLGAEAGGAVRASALDDADVAKRTDARLAELRERLRAAGAEDDAPAAGAFSLIAAGPFPELGQSGWTEPTEEEASDPADASQASGESPLLLGARPAALAIELRAPERPAPESPAAQPPAAETDDDLALASEHGVSMAALAAVMESAPADAGPAEPASDDAEGPAPVDPAASTVALPPDAKPREPGAAKLDLSDLADFAPAERRQRPPAGPAEPGHEPKAGPARSDDDVMELQDRDLFDEDEDDDIMDAELLDEPGDG